MGAKYSDDSAGSGAVSSSARSLYVAFEGIKGCGKTTIANRLCKRLDRTGARYSRIEPTREVDPDSAMERLYRSRPELCRSRQFRAILYSYRSCVAAHLCNWTAPLIVGDRSVITSYATYWNLLASKKEAVSQVELLEPFIKAPDVVFLIDTPVGTCLERIKCRQAAGEKPADIDETLERLGEMRSAYHEIAAAALPRLRGSRWQFIDGSLSLDELESSVWPLMQTEVPVG